MSEPIVPQKPTSEEIKAYQQAAVEYIHAMNRMAREAGMELSLRGDDRIIPIQTGLMRETRNLQRQFYRKTKGLRHLDWETTLANQLEGRTE